MRTLLLIFVEKLRSISARVLLSALLVLATLLYPSTSHSTPGDLYVSEPSSGDISKFAPDGTKSTFASGLDHPGGLAFDRAGNLFVASAGQPGSILKFTPSGERSVFASGFSIPGALAFDGAGNLYVVDNTGDTGGIFQFTPAGTKSAFGSYTGIEWGVLYGLAFSPDGNLFVTTGGPFNLMAESSGLRLMEPATIFRLRMARLWPSILRETST